MKSGASVHNLKWHKNITFLAEMALLRKWGHPPPPRSPTHHDLYYMEMWFFINFLWKDFKNQTEVLSTPKLWFFRLSGIFVFTFVLFGEEISQSTTCLKGTIHIFFRTLQSIQPPPVHPKNMYIPLFLRKLTVIIIVYPPLLCIRPRIMNPHILFVFAVVHIQKLQSGKLSKHVWRSIYLFLGS